MALIFEGFIKDVQYRAFLAENLPSYENLSFDINEVKPSGKILYPNGEFAYSKWVSPKRSRSYPFERLYNTINSPMRLTVIPVLKDEGLDGDLDRIQYSTISWMNLLNIYVVLATYDHAVKNHRPSHLQDFQNFKNLSLNGSKNASLRETQTLHRLEFLQDGVKAAFEIKNYLGGLYYLTADEVIHADGRVIIQESKNSTTRFLPSRSDIKDGLFKLILFSNLDALWLDSNNKRLMIQISSNTP